MILISGILPVCVKYSLVETTSVSVAGVGPSSQRLFTLSIKFMYVYVCWIICVDCVVFEDVLC